MRTMTTKSDSSALVEEFLAKGGKITKCNTVKSGKKRRQPKEEKEEVVEIEVHALPPALAKKFFPND